MFNVLSQYKTVQHYKFYIACSKYNKTVVTNVYKVPLHCNTSSINAEFQMKILHWGLESDSFISGLKVRLTESVWWVISWLPAF